ncbi:hypothetical protein [Mesorhizobium sp.]|nr:hypothetical protein [Mesorhizobium sp.]
MSNLTTFSQDVNTHPAPTGRKPVAPELNLRRSLVSRLVEDIFFDGKV